MSNLSDERFFKSEFLDKTMKLDTSKRSELFSDKNRKLETSYFENKTNFDFSVLPRQSSINCPLFKVPNFECLPVKKAAAKSIRSPCRRVQTGRVKNDLKASQQSKIPRPSFINSKKLYCSRSSQLNARKELIKKMVFLAECTLKENKEIKQSTPVKLLAGLTPKKTPRSGGYFILPEFNKKVPKLEEIRSPLQDLVKKEMFAYSAKATPLLEKINEIGPPVQEEDKSFDIIVKPKDEIKTSSNESSRFRAILCHCKVYSAEVNSIHEKLKILDESFENKLKQIPDYRVYNEFCFYQSKKDELYKEIQKLEVDLRNFISTNTKIGNKLKTYIMKRHEFFENQINLHKNFEEAVRTALEKCEKNEQEEDKTEEEKSKVETPQLRRSLRLSKIKKNKYEESTPITKKLKRLDSKSKGIQKCRKVRSP